MAVNHFVGRNEAVSRLEAVLTGRERVAGQLTVQSIEGSGGIGKTCLFDYVLAQSDLSGQGYVTLRIDGNDPSAASLLRSIFRLTDNVESEALQNKPQGYYFSSVKNVVNVAETVRNEAVSEFQKQQHGDENGPFVIGQYLDFAFQAGHLVNDVFPISKPYLNIQELEKHRGFLESTLPTLKALHKEAPELLDRFGVTKGRRALRNLIKENACRPLADALLSDLAAVLSGYQKKDRFSLAPGKIKGADRLLLVLDDYEKLQFTWGEFLTHYFLPALQKARFESTVIVLGRDSLAATDTAWDQHLKANLLKPIHLKPLTRDEMNELVASYGFLTEEEKERAWQDTQGYPFYVQLWSEEAESGGRSAVMLKRFYDRTTRWMTEQEKQWLQHTLFLEEVNIRSLQTMLGDKAEAEEGFRWFEREGSVRDPIGSSFRVREYLRSRLADYLRLSDPERYEELESRSLGT